VHGSCRAAQWLAHKQRSAGPTTTAMGNRAGAFCGGNVCPKAGHGDNEIFDDTSTCDPAGAVFQETLEDLSEVDRLLLTFSSSANLAVVRWLFVLGANIDACDTNGTTCLHAACRSGSLAIVRELIRRELPLNATDIAGWTALHVALFMSRRSVAVRLMQSGADPAPRNLKGHAPADLCSDVWLREAIASCIEHRRCHGQGKPWSFGRDGDSSEDAQVCSPLRFEPFFVPRAPVLKDSGDPALLDIGMLIFEYCPGQGLAFLVATGAVPDFPVKLSCFMLENRVNPVQVGEFLGENVSLAQTLRLEFFNSVRLIGTGVVSCLSKVFKQFHAPSDLHKIDRLVDGVAQIWWRQHEQVKEAPSTVDLHSEEDTGEVCGLRLMSQLSGYDVLHQLMLSTILLHWNLYAPLPQSRRVSLEAWLDMNAHLAETGLPEAANPNMMRHALMLIYGLISHTFFPQMQIWSSRAPPGSGMPGCGAGRAVLRENTDTQKGSLEACSGTAPIVEGWALLVGGSFPSLVGSSGTVTYRHIRSILSETSSSTLAIASPVTSRSSRPQAPDHDAVGAGGMPPSVTYRHPGFGSGGQVTHACTDGKAAIPSATNHDKVWLSLRHDLLFLASKPSNWSPYAFLHLEDVVVQSMDKAAMTLTLSMRSPRLPETGLGPTVGSSLAEGLAQILEAPMMQLIFLLPDGRWQVLDIPYMQVQVPDVQQLEKWRLHFEDASLRGPGKRCQTVVDREAWEAEGTQTI